MNKPPKQRKKKGKEGETLNHESEGREGNYATRMPRHATLTKLVVQRKHNVRTWPVHAPKRHTAGQESAPHAHEQW